MKQIAIFFVRVWRGAPGENGHGVVDTPDVMNGEVFAMTRLVWGYC